MTKQEKIERFWSHIDVKSIELCWDWKCATNPAGYGVTDLFRKEYGTNLAHRIALILTQGKLTNKQCSCHKCDRPSCCNPHHLFIGTLNDNMEDAIEKGRMKRGAKIKPITDPINPTDYGIDRDTYQKLIKMHECGYTTSELSQFYNIPESTICSII